MEHIHVSIWYYVLHVFNFHILELFDNMQYTNNTQDKVYTFIYSIITSSLKSHLHTKGFIGSNFYIKLYKKDYLAYKYSSKKREKRKK